jgi:hypothetical protein
VRDAVEFLCIAALPVVLGLATLGFFRSRVRGRARVGFVGLAVGNLLLLLALAFVLLLAFETQLRFCYDASDGDNRTRVSKRWFERHWRDNSFGVRDDVDYALRPAPGRRRISFVGDSFTAGHGVANVAVRYPNLLRARHPEWEVHALAIPGLETPEETKLLRDLIARGYVLDVVVLEYYVENVGRFVPELREYFRALEAPMPQPLRFLMEHSFALDTFAYRAQTRWMYASGYWSGVYARAFAGEPWLAQQAAFDRFRQLVERNAGTFAVITFPTLAGVEGRSAMLQRIDAFWAERGVPHLDLLPVYEPYAARELVANPHDAHPGELAHRLAADAVERFLVEGVLPGSPAPR